MRMRIQPGSFINPVTGVDTATHTREDLSVRRWKKPIGDIYTTHNPRDFAPSPPLFRHCPSVYSSVSLFR